MSLDTPVPQFPHLPNGADNTAHPVGLLWRGNESGCGASLAGTHCALQKAHATVPMMNPCYTGKQRRKVHGMSVHSTHSSIKSKGQEVLGRREKIRS